MSSENRWSDLRPRVITGGSLALVGVGAMFAGGPVFLAVCAISCGIMVWEVARLVDPTVTDRAALVGILAVATVQLAPELPPAIRLPLAFLPPLLGYFILTQRRRLFLVFAVAIQVAAYGLSDFRAEHGVIWLVWLVLLVVATDIAGYFVGKTVGGPKFWPQISPNKTWSGTVAGWVCAAIIGAIFLGFTNAGRDIIWISVLASFAAQMGDIAESALKRHVGAKDSSDLLPGHGGLYDRFDGLLGASLFMLLVAQFTPIPGLAQ